MLAVSLTQSAYATAIDDLYTGRNVIGADIFKIHSMDVEILADKIPSATININLSGKGDEGMFASLTYSGNCTDCDDLF